MESKDNESSRISKAIRIALVKRNYKNATEFANQNNFNQSLISQWITGTVSPSMQSVERLAAAFNMKVPDFLALGDD